MVLAMTASRVPPLPTPELQAGIAATAAFDFVGDTERTVAKVVEKMMQKTAKRRRTFPAQSFLLADLLITL